MLKSNKLAAAIAALSIFLCCAILPAAEGVPAPAKKYAEMTVEEMVEYFKTLDGSQIAAVVNEIIESNDGYAIDVAGKAFSVVCANLDQTLVVDIKQKFYQVSKDIVAKDNGVFLPVGTFGTVDNYYLNAGNPLAEFAAGNNNVQGNQSLVSGTPSAPDVPQRHEAYSLKPSAE